MQQMQQIPFAKVGGSRTPSQKDLNRNGGSLGPGVVNNDFLPSTTMVHSSKHGGLNLVSSPVK